MYIAMYCCILRNESGLWHTFSDKIFLENFLENFFGKDDIFGKVCFYYEEKKKDSKRNFYSDLFIF